MSERAKNNRCQIAVGLGFEPAGGIGKSENYLVIFLSSGFALPFSLSQSISSFIENFSSCRAFIHTRGSLDNQPKSMS